MDLSPSKKVCFICFNESSLKVMENAFYFIVKALFVFKIFKFLTGFFWSSRKSSLVNLKIYGVTNRLQTNSIHILPIVSRSKGNRTMKFGQLIQYNKRHIQISCRKWGKKLGYRPLFVFLKKLYMR